MNIGIVIKEVRQQKGLTQQELSENAGLSVRTVQRIENDEVEPSFYSLKSLGEILGVDLLEIRNRNSMMFTSKILGIDKNNFHMIHKENGTIDERLERIESHLSSIATLRTIQLRRRKVFWIILGSILGIFIIIEILAALSAI